MRTVYLKVLQDFFIFFTRSLYYAAMMVRRKEIIMSTKNKWLTGIGIALGLIVLFALPFVWQAVFPAQTFGMMGYGNMPMQGFGFSHMRSGMGFGMFFLWLIPLALLTLVGLSIAALIKYLRTPTA
jgi:hypothetical protein